MAAEDEGRTEEASESKLERARREEGRVPKSKEISDSLILLLVIVTVYFLSRWLLKQCIQIFQFYFNRCFQNDIRDSNLATAFFSSYLKIILPTSAVAVVAGLAANIVQNRGFIFTTKPLQPQLNKLIPNFGEYFKRTLFSTKGLFNIAKSIGKVAIIVLIGYSQIKKDVPVLIQVINNGQILAALGLVARMAFTILLITAIFFVVLSIPDYIIERRRFLEDMKMTKYEQKQEYKEQEGDPVMKSRMVQAQRQMLRQNVRQAVKEADVVIANPTHVAVALKYDEKTASSPMVTAKGIEETALFIKNYAIENKVPVVENRPVARVLYTNVEVGDIIVDDYIIRAVAEIYRHLEKFSKKRNN